jgi:hypothetical protein
MGWNQRGEKPSFRAPMWWRGAAATRLKCLGMNGTVTSSYVFITELKIAIWRLALSVAWQPTLSVSDTKIITSRGLALSVA